MGNSLNEARGPSRAIQGSEKVVLPRREAMPYGSVTIVIRVGQASHGVFWPTGDHESLPCLERCSHYSASE